MKIQYSALVNSTSGKLNGSVASHNKGGSYLRNKGIVANPRTALQTLQRGILGSISSQWRLLTQDQRNDWMAAAAEWPYTDPFGQTKYLSGAQLFTKLNVNLATNGQTPNFEAPIKVQMPTWNYNEFTLAFDLTPVDPDEANVQSLLVDFISDPAFVDLNFVVQFSPMLSSGISNPTTNWRRAPFVAAIPIGTTGILDLSGSFPYHTFIGTDFIPGKKVFIRIAAMNFISGQMTPWQQTSAIIDTIA